MIKTQKVNVIDVNDWDNLVSETYGKPYSFQQQDGCKSRQHVSISVPELYPEDYENDTIPEVINGNKMGVSFQTWLKRDPNAPLNCTEKEAKDCNYYWGISSSDLKKWQKDKSHISMFYERNFYPSIGMIINDLHSKGLLEAGNYKIDIDW